MFAIFKYKKQPAGVTSRLVRTIRQTEQNNKSGGAKQYVRRSKTTSQAELSIPAPDGRRGSGTGSRTNIPDTARTRARILYPSACAQSV